jgi:hypothetical protein
MYIGNDLQIAHPSYKIIDDISSGFNGSTTSFALQVSGATPVPFPISTQQVMISVNGVVQEPDPNGGAGFKLLGSNIVFSSAPANGHAFFGVINAGADYVTAGSEFPDGSATAPSFTFQDDQDTGWFRSGSGAVGYSANGVNTIGFDGNGLTVTGDASFVGDSAKNLLWDKSDGQLEFADNAKATFGASLDLEIYHSSSNASSYIQNSTGNLFIEAPAGSAVKLRKKGTTEVLLQAISDGAVELYHNNVKQLETTSIGISTPGYLYLTGDGKEIRMGAGGDFRLFHDGSHNRIDSTNGNIYLRHGTDNAIKTVPNGTVELYYDDSLRFQTDSNGCTVHSTRLQFMDNTKAQFGTGGDLQIYFDGTNSYITEPSAQVGQLILQGWNGTDIRQGSTGEHMIRAIGGGAVELYHDNSKKFESISAGAKVTGELHINSNGSLIKENQLKFSPSGAAYIDHSTVSQNIIFRTSSSSALDTTALTLASNGNGSFAGTVSDSKGNLRSIPNDTKTSAYTLVASDAGKCIRITTGGVTVPNSVFAEGDAVTIINQSGSDQTITAGSGFSLYNSGDGSAGNRTLAGRGMATMMFAASDAAYISGAGLS